MPRVNRTNSKGIVAWPEGERPRERLLRLGAQSVTDAELVAILLRGGLQGTSAVELARQILKKFVGPCSHRRECRLQFRGQWTDG